MFKNLDKCCCGLITIRHGVLIIAILDIISVILNYHIISAFYVFDQYESEYKRKTWISGAVGGIILFITAIILLIAVVNRKWYLVVPHLIMSILTVFGLIAAGIVGSIISNKADEDFQRIFSLSAAILSFLLVALKIWFIIVLIYFIIFLTRNQGSSEKQIEFNDMMIKNLKSSSRV